MLLPVLPMAHVVRCALPLSKDRQETVAVAKTPSSRKGMQTGQKNGHQRKIKKEKEADRKDFWRQ